MGPAGKNEEGGTKSKRLGVLTISFRAPELIMYRHAISNDCNRRDRTCRQVP